jgi:hypothetical protein
MGCIIKNKTRFYKKTLVDLWGYHFMYRKTSKTINFFKVMRAINRARSIFYKSEFIYSYKKKKSFPRQKRFKEKFIQRRYLKNFYLVLSYRRLRYYIDRKSVV